ncbi:MAG TPA: amino acid racemase [Chloroflexota bacterium]
MAEKAIGILGGMGPEATVDLFAKIVAATPARTDREHLRIIVDDNPKVPDRIRAIFDGGEDPVPVLRDMARNLEHSGAGLLVIACNTAHVYYDAITEAVAIPILHIADEAVAELLRRYPGVRVVGVLGTDVTIRLGIYHSRLERSGVRPITPEPSDQEIVLSCIASVKAGDKGSAVRARLLAVAERLVARGAGVLITACTELPLLLRDGDASVPILDPTQTLALAAVRLARS